MFSKIVLIMDHTEKLMELAEKKNQLFMKFIYYVVMVFCGYQTLMFSAMYIKCSYEFRILLIIGIGLILHKLFTKRLYFALLKRFVY